MQIKIHFIGFQSCEVADGRVKGVHFLMRKNKVTEYDGRGTFTGPKSITVTKSDGATEDRYDDKNICRIQSTQEQH